MVKQESASAYDAIWHNDGDLIIKVSRNGDSPTDLHRVHSGPLKLHSDVIRNMVTRAQAETAAQPDLSLHGCPTIQLEDDPRDVCRLLNVLYYPGIISRQRLRQTTFDELEPVLWLATKYKMHDLVNRFLPTLEQDWPTTLHRWDMNEFEIQGLYKQIQSRDDVYLDDITPEPCRVIRLARECGFDSILPAAFYHLARLELDQDDSIDATELQLGARRAARKYLTVEDWNSLYHGIGKIRSWCAAFRKDIRSNLLNTLVGFNHLRTPTSCLESAMAIMDEPQCAKLDSGEDRHFALDPLMALQETYTATVSHSTSKSPRLCTGCQIAVEEMLLDKRNEFWENLPSFFLLPKPHGWKRSRNLTRKFMKTHIYTILSFEPSYTVIGAFMCTWLLIVIILTLAVYQPNILYPTPPLSNQNSEYRYAYRQGSRR